MTVETLITAGVEFAGQNRELILLSGTLLIAAIGLNWRQREAIRKRDNYECQGTDKRITCGGRLEVDHIIPKEFAEKVLKMTPEEYNDPSNLVTLCFNHHRGHQHSHHPDIHAALWAYENGDLNAITNAVEQHKTKTVNGEIYWNSENDGEHRQVAKRRTQMTDEQEGGRSKWWPFCRRK